MMRFFAVAVCALLACAHAFPSTTYCYNREDPKAHKCYEGCATKDFKSGNLKHPGTCNPNVFKVVESSKIVEACSDSKTNLKYCTGSLYPVNITMKVKGEAFATEANAPIKCGTGDVVKTILVRSHAINAAKVDWCLSNSTMQGDKCTSCLDALPAQPGTASIAIGADVDYFVFALKGSEVGKEQELYPDFVSGDWPMSYDLQDPTQVALTQEAPTTCGTGKGVKTMLVRSHAINAAKVDWCVSKPPKGPAGDVCTSCMDALPAQPGNATITIGDDVDYFVFAFKGDEAGKEQELYPDFVSGDWPESYDLQDPS